MVGSRFPVLAIRAAMILVGAALVVVADGRQAVATFGWGLVAVAVLSEALASAVFLWRRRGRADGV